jgi:uncharacterized protein YbjT (DUF2867 family)
MDFRVTVVGGTGFIGRALVERLASRGASVRIVSRHAPGDAALSARTEHISGSIEDPAVVARAVDGAAAVVYLVGTTTARNDREFYTVHRDAPRRLADAARRAGVRRFAYASAMGVGSDAPALADRSKAAGERAVRDVFPDANVVRPSLVYGPGDHFFSRFAMLVRSSPVIPLIGGGRTRFQPMHVEDVAEAMARMLEEPATVRRVFELGANEVYSFRELIERLCQAVGRRPWLVPIAFPLAETGAYLTQWLPQAPLTVDQVRLLKTDKVMLMHDAQGVPGALGVRPRSLAPCLADMVKPSDRL